ncbi:MAG TPA: diguanylate cyclase [Syntrophomonas sp.]|nr:diguanylate cyclase [Syntrophomonas sp.]
MEFNAGQEEVTGLTGEIILEKMLDVVECAVACYQMVLREEQRDYQFVAVNHTFESLSGHDRSQLLGRCLGRDHFSGLFPGFDLAAWLSQSDEVSPPTPLLLLGNSCYQSFLHKLDKDHLVSVFYDVTAMHSYQQKFELVFNSANALQSITTYKEDEDGIYVDVNERLCSTIGLSREEIIGRSWIDINLFANSDDKHLIKLLIARDKRIDNLELITYNRQGEKIHGLLTSEIIAINNQQFAFSMVHDITEFRRIEKELAEKNQQLEELNQLLSRQATRDDLTGLYNRRHIFAILNKEIIRSKRYGYPLSLMMLDLDKFKAVNDNYGHQFGDFMLQKTARILLSNIRETDRLGRYGGEEFLLILTHTDLQAAEVVAQRIINAVAQASFGEDQIKITISIGVCDYQGESRDKFVQCADDLLYQAKKAGRNRFVAKSLPSQK